MTQRTENIYEIISDLSDLIIDLQVDLSETKKQVRILREVLTGEGEPAEATTVQAEPLREASEDRRPTTQSVARRVETAEETLEENDLSLYTGVTDFYGKKLYLNDLVILRTSSGGLFATRRNYQKGDTAIVCGVTRNKDIKVRDPINKDIKETVRKGDSVIRAKDL